MWYTICRGDKDQIVSPFCQPYVSSVKTKKLYPVAIHFNNPNHSINDVEIIVIEACTSNDTHRKLRESHWIHQLKTLQLYGLNINTGIK